MSRDIPNLPIPIPYCLPMSQTLRGPHPHAIRDTNKGMIKVDFGAIAGTGGSPIIKYEVQMSDEHLQNWGVHCQELATTCVVTKGIIGGQNYIFRYRAWNSVGAGGWSELSVVQAATIPGIPKKPSFLSATANSVTLSFNQAVDNGGSELLSFQLFVDGSNDATYNGQDLTYTVGLSDPWATI